MSTRIKIMIIVFLLTTFSAAFFNAGYKFSDIKHANFLISIKDEHLKAIKEQQSKNAEIEKVSKDYYEKFIAASNADPVIVTKRVYVKATCTALPENSGGILGNEEGEQRAELHKETLRRITAVTDGALKDVLQCRAKLNSLQDKITIFNKR